MRSLRAAPFGGNSRPPQGPSLERSVSGLDRSLRGKRDGPAPSRPGSPATPRYRREARAGSRGATRWLSAWGCSPAAGGIQLGLVSTLGQLAADDSRCFRSGMFAILLQHERKLLPDELGPRDSPFLSCVSEELIHAWFERNGGRLLSSECHESNITLSRPLRNLLRADGAGFTIQPRERSTRWGDSSTSPSRQP